MYNNLIFYNSYNRASFLVNAFLGRASRNDYITEIINTSIDFSSMNSYNKECYKALVSSLNYCFNRK